MLKKSQVKKNKFLEDYLKKKHYSLGIIIQMLC